MGCDIHLHVEAKYNDEWIHWAAPNVDRNYTLFSKMAGVRGNENPISLPKGFPKDANITTRLNYETGEYYHSVSWLSLEEVKELEEWIRSRGKWPDNDLEYGTLKGTYLFGNSLCVPARKITDIRFVFWFDN